MTKSRVSVALGLMLAMAAVPALGNVKAGVDAWDRGDYPRAVATWRPLAVAGDADAQFNLAQAYKLGRGVPVDLKMAEDWYRKAADQGHIRAEDNLGLVMFQNGDRQRALPYIERSAGRGDARAQYIMATSLFNGDMVKKDWVRAYALMTRASASGLAPASASLAQMDKYIPLEQRQKGLAMARDLELAQAKPLSGDDPVSAVARPPRVAGSTIKPSPVPPYEPPVIAPPIATPKPVVRPAPAKVAVVTPKPASVAAPKPAPAPPPKPAAVSGPAWRVQLGAFGDQGNARALWSQLEGRVAALGGLQPYLVRAGSVTRLQAGPIAGKAAAERVCASVKASGQGCLPVAP